MKVKHLYYEKTIQIYTCQPKTSPGLSKGTPPALIIKVNELLQCGKLRDAADILTKEILIHPENKDALVILGQVNEKRSGKEIYKEFNQNKPPKVTPKHFIMSDRQE